MYALCVSGAVNRQGFMCFFVCVCFFVLFFALYINFYSFLHSVCSSCLLASILLGFNVELPNGAGIAHRVKRPTETPDVTLTRVRVPGAARFFFFFFLFSFFFFLFSFFFFLFFPESASSAVSLTVSVQPPCTQTLLGCPYSPRAPRLS